MGKGAEAAGCTRTRKMCVVNCHPRSIRAPSFARAVTRTLRIVVVEAIRRLLFTCMSSWKINLDFTVDFEMK